MRKFDWNLDRVPSIVVAAAVFFAGFFVMLIQWSMSNYIGNRGFFYYLSATWGDALCLPAISYVISRRLKRIKWNKVLLGTSIVSCLLGTFAGAVIQNSWLKDTGTIVNWTFAEVGKFNSAGWYHAVFFIAVCAWFSFGAIFVFYDLVTRSEWTKTDVLEYMSLGYSAVMFVVLQSTDNVDSIPASPLRLNSAPLMFAVVVTGISMLPVLIGRVSWKQCRLALLAFALMLVSTAAFAPIMLVSRPCGTVIEILLGVSAFVFTLSLTYVPANAGVAERLVRAAPPAILVLLFTSKAQGSFRVAASVLLVLLLIVGVYAYINNEIDAKEERIRGLHAVVLLVLLVWCAWANIKGWTIRSSLSTDLTILFPIPTLIFGKFWVEGHVDKNIIAFEGLYGSKQGLVGREKKYRFPTLIAYILLCAMVLLAVLAKHLGQAGEQSSSHGWEVLRNVYIVCGVSIVCGVGGANIFAKRWFSVVLNGALFASIGLFSLLCVIRELTGNSIDHIVYSVVLLFMGFVGFSLTFISWRGNVYELFAHYFGRRERFVSFCVASYCGTISAAYGVILLITPSMTGTVLLWVMATVWYAASSLVGCYLVVRLELPVLKEERKVKGVSVGNISSEGAIFQDQMSVILINVLFWGLCAWSYGAVASVLEWLGLIALISIPLSSVYVYFLKNNRKHVERQIEELSTTSGELEWYAEALSRHCLAQNRMSFFGLFPISFVRLFIPGLCQIGDGEMSKYFRNFYLLK